jgi:predicted glutamate--cysteine ligase
MSHRVKAAMPDFHTEPDCRNSEFATEPHTDYEDLLREFMGFRMRLREFIRAEGDYTLVPGGALSLGDTSAFQITDPDNEYYRYIRDAYGTNVVTASTHISVGVEDSEEIIRLYRVLRCEAALYLAITAASPWLDGKATGYHSTRWHIFPRTPGHVPFFNDHEEYAGWMEDKLASGEMQNSRHLWLSARPNGTEPPRFLNRVELRVCDRISYPSTLFGVTAMLEARILYLLAHPEADPFISGVATAGELVQRTAENENAVSRASLDATVWRWSDGARVPVRAWIAEMMDEVRPYAMEGAFDGFFSGVTRMVEKGSIARRWLERQEQGESVRDILRDAIRHAEICDEACSRAPCECFSEMEDA